MLGISLIWRICHKLMWFYRNAVLFYIILSWGMAKSLVIWRYRYFDSKQNGAADRGISGDGVIFLLLLKEIRLQLSQKASQQVLLQHVSHTAETDKVTVIGPLIQATWSSSDPVCLLYTLSTIAIQESKLRVPLELEVLAKLKVGENSSWELPKVGVHLYIRGVSYIRDKTVHIFNKLGKALMSRWNGYQNKLIFIQQKEFENVICEMVAILLTHCGLMMPYGDTDLGQRWLG